MQPAAFYDGLRAAIKQVGGEEGTVIRMHPGNWHDMMEAIGPPYEVRAQRAREHAERTGRGFVLTPKRWPDGEVMGMFQGCKVYSDDQVQRHLVVVRRGSAILNIAAGPFPPAVEPEGGWPDDRPLFLPQVIDAGD